MMAVEAQAIVTEIIQHVLTYASPEKHGKDFVPTGTMLLGLLTTIAISWAGIKMLFDSSSPNEIIASMFNIAFLAGIASFMIHSGGAEMLNKGFNEAAEIATGKSAVSATASPEAALGNFIDAAQKLFIGDEELAKKEAAAGSAKKIEAADPGELGGVDAAIDFFKGAISFSPVNQIVMYLVNLLFKLVIALFIVLAGILYVGQYLVTQIMVQLGLMVMPLMVPFIVLSGTSFIFDGWLKFMITAGMQKIVGAFMFGMTYSMLDKAEGLIAISGSLGGGQFINFSVYSVLLLLVALMAYLMMQVPAIALGLLSGASRGTFNVPSKLSPGGFGNTVGGGISKTGSSIKNYAQSKLGPKPPSPPSPLPKTPTKK